MDLASLKNTSPTPQEDENSNNQEPPQEAATTRDILEARNSNRGEWFLLDNDFGNDFFAEARNDNREELYWFGHNAYEADTGVPS
jgi:hypothetical protein